MATAKRNKRSKVSMEDDAYQYKPTKKDKIRSMFRRKIKLEAKSANQKIFIEALKDDNKELVIASGISGCGKTFLSIVEALNLLQDDSNSFEEIIIFKSVKCLDGEDMGFLPGTVDEKLLYIYQSYFQHLEKFITPEDLKKFYDEKIIKVLPLGTIRGVSISPKAIVIVDEVQNLTVEKVHTVLTRMEEGSKLILIGDVFQRDHKNKTDNGLIYLNENFKDINDKIKVIEFCDADSVARNPLIVLYQKIFEKHLDKQEANRVAYKEKKQLNG